MEARGAAAAVAAAAGCAALMLARRCLGTTRPQHRGINAEGAAPTRAAPTPPATTPLVREVGPEVIEAACSSAAASVLALLAGTAREGRGLCALEELRASKQSPKAAGRWLRAQRETLKRLGLRCQCRINPDPVVVARACDEARHPELQADLECKAQCAGLWGQLVGVDDYYFARLSVGGRVLSFPLSVVEPHARPLL
eukprot:Hpha_TRINITY_DN6028_c0_g2::TRINITY_DN6028_c0_g2_i1::g.63371::m.63371